MKENLTTFTLFSIILTTIVGLFAALGYPLWAFPVTILTVSYTHLTLPTSDLV